MGLFFFRKFSDEKLEGATLLSNSCGWGVLAAGFYWSYFSSKDFLKKTGPCGAKDVLKLLAILRGLRGQGPFGGSGYSCGAKDVSKLLAILGGLRGQGRFGGSGYSCGAKGVVISSRGLPWAAGLLSDLLSNPLSDLFSIPL